MARLQLRAGRSREPAGGSRRPAPSTGGRWASWSSRRARALREAGHADTPAALRAGGEQPALGRARRGRPPAADPGAPAARPGPAGLRRLRRCRPPTSDEAAEEATIDLGAGGHPRSGARPAALRNPVRVRPPGRPPSVPIRPEPAAARQPAEPGCAAARLREAEKRQAGRARARAPGGRRPQAAQEALDDLERRASAARETLRAAEEARAEAEAALRGGSHPAGGRRRSHLARTPEPLVQAARSEEPTPIPGSAGR